MKTSLPAKILFATVPMAFGLVAVTAGAASAADSPTNQELLAQCQRAQICEFHPSGSPSIHAGPEEFVGSATNCTGAEQKRTFSHTITEGTSNSFGIEITASATLGKAFETAVTTSFHKEWNWSASTTDTLEQTVAPHTRADIYAAKQKTRINGSYELHFKKKYFGHWIWYSGTGWIDGQSKGPSPRLHLQARHPQLLTTRTRLEAGRCVTGAGFEAHREVAPSTSRH